MVNRNQLPRWVNALIDAVADAPMSPIGRIAAKRLGTPVPGAALTTRFEERRFRILIAPVNYAGQGFAWARSLEAARPEISSRNMAIDVPGGFSFEADLTVPVPTYHNDSEWQHRQFAAATRATHVLIEAEEPPFGRLFDRSVKKQASALEQHGVDVAHIAHGTDVRLPSRHLRDNPWSHYADPTIYTPRHETTAQRNIDFLSESGRTVFVSTPDLLLDLPEAIWCPVVVDPDRWAPPAPRTERARDAPLRVAHAPSVQAVKGTSLIMPILTALEAEGVISLQLITGVPSERMPEAFAAADVVIDQLRIGSYGVAACEAMASGCVVIGHVPARVRDLVFQSTGQHTPIVEATVDTIESTLRELASQKDLSVLRSAGHTFIREVHDGSRSADILWRHWIAPTSNAETERTAL